MEQLRAAIDDLAEADVVGVPQRKYSRRFVAGRWRGSKRSSRGGSRSSTPRSNGPLMVRVRRRVGWSRICAWRRVRRTIALHVARQTAEMPVTTAAWQKGAISSRHVDALTRVRHGAKADAQFAVFEPVLVDVAREGRPEDVANVGRQWRDALDADLDRDGADRRKSADYDRRHLNYSRSIRGLGFINGMFDPEGAALADAALKRAVERTRAKNDLRSPGQLRADAMADIYRHYLDHQSRGTNRPHLMMAVDPATYSGEAVGLCEKRSAVIASTPTPCAASRAMRSSNASCSTPTGSRSTWAAERVRSHRISTGRSCSATADVACRAVTPDPKTAKRITR